MKTQLLEENKASLCLYMHIQDTVAQNKHKNRHRCTSAFYIHIKSALDAH